MKLSIILAWMKKDLHKWLLHCSDLFLPLYIRPIEKKTHWSWKKGRLMTFTHPHLFKGLVQTKNIPFSQIFITHWGHMKMTKAATSMNEFLSLWLCSSLVAIRRSATVSLLVSPFPRHLLYFLPTPALSPPPNPPTPFSYWAISTTLRTC